MSYFILTCAVIPNLVHTANILIWNPTIAYCHVKFLGSIADVLTADGHNVTIFSPVIEPKLKAFHNRLPAHTLTFSARSVGDGYLKTVKTTSIWETITLRDPPIIMDEFDLLYELTANYCKDLIEDKQMLSKLNVSKFDLAYNEALDNCAPGIFEILGIRNVVLLSVVGALHQLNEVAGLSDFPSFVPGLTTPYSDQMTFMERLKNFKANLEMRAFMDRWDRKIWGLFDAKYPGFPSILSIYHDKTSLIMTNVNEFAQSSRPTSNMIKYIGGIALSDPEPLPSELDRMLSKRGKTVLFSMGSIARSVDMPAWLKKDILETFDSFPDVTFIWKYEGDDIAFNAHPNVHPMKWIPQVDLLADKRLSLFITHGGINSLLEAIHHGKPLIVIPLFGDQPYTARNIERRGLGMIIKPYNLNKKTLTETIARVLNDDKMHKKAAFVASMLEGRPQRYREDIAKWARLIVKYGKMEHLVMHSRNLSFIQYYCLDIIGCMLGVAVASLLLLLWLLKRIYAYGFGKIKSD